MASTDLLHRRAPPDNPGEFLEMVSELDERRKSRRLADQKNQKPCSHACGGVIAAEGTPGEPGYRERAPLRRKAHHALQLADEIQRSTKLGKQGLKSRQKGVLAEWEAFRKDRSKKSLLERLGRTDGKEVTEAEMRDLIRIFSVIFFRTRSADEKMNVRFTWTDWSDTPQLLGQYRNINRPRISMCAFNYFETEGHGRLNKLAMDRLATLLHELVHAYLDIYACRCEEVPDSYEANVSQSAGHGQAWQRIAGSIERAAPELLGYPLDMDRFMSLKMHWQDLKHWPSQEEAERWQLVYSKTEENSDNESCLSSPPDSDLEMTEPVDRSNDPSLIVKLRLPRRNNDDHPDEQPW